MKKILSVLIVGIVLTISSHAQGFEGGHLTSTFTNKFDNISEASIGGKSMYFDDYGPNPRSISVKRRLSDGEGKAYAFLLLKDPSRLNLTRTIPNVIITHSGAIVILYSDKTGQWEVLFASNAVGINYPIGCRVFTLS